MLEELKKAVFRANLDLVKYHLVVFTWGNVSAVDREKNLVVIKPSGIEYEKMKFDDMVVVDLQTGEKVEGDYNPSSDTHTHLELYRSFPSIGGITHTHSINSVAFAQAGVDLPALGTTQADYFYGDIPCTRELSHNEVENGYEVNTGKAIVECFIDRGIEPMRTPGVLVKNHGPFSWGKDADESVYHAVVMETVAEMAIKTLLLNQKAVLPQFLLDKHYFRKHGSDAYYGQR